MLSGVGTIMASQLGTLWIDSAFKYFGEINSAAECE